MNKTTYEKCSKCGADLIELETRSKVCNLCLTLAATKRINAAVERDRQQSTGENY